MERIDVEPFSITGLKQRLIADRKLVRTYAGGFLLMALVFGSLGLIQLTNSSELLRMIQLFAFFGLGWINTSFLQSAPFLTRNHFQEYLIFTILLALLICIFLIGIYWIGNSSILLAFASTCVFLLPFTLMQSWFFYKHIPKDRRFVWRNSETVADQHALSFRNRVHIRFQVTRKYYDLLEIKYPLTVSSWVKVGTLFNQFILEQNTNGTPFIELKDERQYPYGWEFYAESIGGLLSRQLDPELNVKENRISRSEIIVVRRVKLEPESNE